VGGLIGHCVSPPTVERDRRACPQQPWPQSVCGVMQQRVYRTPFRISMNSKSDCLKSGAENYRHCYQWMEKASGQLDNWINYQANWQKSGQNVLHVCNF